jgi:hypothetical protein
MPPVFPSMRGVLGEEAQVGVGNIVKCAWHWGKLKLRWRLTATYIDPIWNNILPNEIPTYVPTVCRNCTWKELFLYRINCMGWDTQASGPVCKIVSLTTSDGLRVYYVCIGNVRYKWHCTHNPGYVTIPLESGLHYILNRLCYQSKWWWLLVRNLS